MDRYTPGESIEHYFTTRGDDGPKDPTAIPIPVIVFLNGNPVSAPAGLFVNSLGAGLHRLAIETIDDPVFVVGDIWGIVAGNTDVDGNSILGETIYQFRMANPPVSLVDIASLFTPVMALLNKIYNKVAKIGTAAWMSFSGKRLGPFMITLGDSFNETTGQKITFSFSGVNDISSATVTGQLRYKNGEKIADLTGEIVTSSPSPGDIQEAAVFINHDDFDPATWLPSREGREHEILCKIVYDASNIATVGRADVVLERG